MACGPSPSPDEHSSGGETALWLPLTCCCGSHCLVPAPDERPSGLGEGAWALHVGSQRSELEQSQQTDQ